MHFPALAALALLQGVQAHGYLKPISVNNGPSYLAWQVGVDDYLSFEPIRYALRVKVSVLLAIYLPSPLLSPLLTGRTRMWARLTYVPKDNGPVPNFTTKDITCNVGGNPPSQSSVSLLPGDKVKLQWDQWVSCGLVSQLNFLIN
jgi:cellulase